MQESVTLSKVNVIIVYHITLNFTDKRKHTLKPPNNPCTEDWCSHSSILLCFICCFSPRLATLHTFSVKISLLFAEKVIFGILLRQMAVYINNEGHGKW